MDIIEDAQKILQSYGDMPIAELMRTLLEESGYDMSAQKHYTWEEKIDSLVKLAKAAGRYINGEGGLLSPSAGSDYHRAAQRRFYEAYEEFCEWRHDEPYVVDEIKGLLKRQEENG